MKAKIISITAATLILFLWNAISWMALPFHSQSLQTLPQEVVGFTELSSVRLDGGVYHYPGLPESNSPDDLKELEEKLSNGPRIPLMVVKPGPSQLFNPTDFLVSLALNFVTAATLFILLLRIAPHGLTQVIGTCVLLGVIVSSMSDLALMNWYRLPWSFVWPGIADHVVGLSLAGVALHTIYLKKSL